MEGLRERSKAKRRASIERTALLLFAERGYDATTIADIADAAEVAPRTVTLYFPAKIDLALSYPNGVAIRIGAAFADALAGNGSLLTVIETWLRAEAQTQDRDLAALHYAVTQTNPTLRGLSSGPITHAVELGNALLARELARPADDLTIRIVGGAIGAVIDGYLTAIADGADADAARTDALTFLQAGLTALAATHHPATT